MRRATHTTAAKTKTVQNETIWTDLKHGVAGLNTYCKRLL